VVRWLIQLRPRTVWERGAITAPLLSGRLHAPPSFTVFCHSPLGYGTVLTRSPSLQTWSSPLALSILSTYNSMRGAQHADFWRLFVNDFALSWCRLVGIPAIHGQFSEFNVNVLIVHRGDHRRCSDVKETVKRTWCSTTPRDSSFLSQPSSKRVKRLRGTSLSPCGDADIGHFRPCPDAGIVSQARWGFPWKTITERRQQPLKKRSVSTRLHGGYFWSSLCDGRRRRAFSSASGFVGTNTVTGTVRLRLLLRL